MKNSFWIALCSGCLLVAGCGTAPIRREPPAKRPHRVTITLMGDILPAHWPVELVYRDIRRKGGESAVYDYPFAKVKPFLEGVVYGNLEGPLTEEKIKKFSDKDERSYFQIPAKYVETLKRAGFDVMSLANNHMRDCGDKGLLDTVKNLRRAGIHPVGAGKNMAAARKPVVIRANGLDIAFLSYLQVQPRSVWATATTPGVARGGAAVVAADVHAARRIADVVVVNFHWGKEYFNDWSVKRVEAERVRLAHAAVDAGAFLVVGHHSHTAEPIESYKRGLIAYSLGNFVFAASTREGHPESMLIQVEVDSTGVVSHQVVPVLISPKRARYQPRPLSGKDKELFLRRLAEINRSHFLSLKGSGKKPLK